MFHICHAFLSVYCNLVVTCWERAKLLAFLCVMFYCVFVTFLCGVLGQVWYLIVSIPDLCLLTYFSQRGKYSTVQKLAKRYRYQHSKDLRPFIAYSVTEFETVFCSLIFFNIFVAYCKYRQI